MLPVMIAFILVISALFYMFFYANGHYWEAYWKKRGVKFYMKNRNLGLFWDLVVQPDRTVFQCISDIYNNHKDEPALGLGCLITPGLLVIDPVNSQYVLENDFKSFSHRGIKINHDDFLGSSSLLFSKGTEWKMQRRFWTSLFTTSKLKDMIYSVDDTAKEFVEYLKTNPNRKESTFLTLKRVNGAVIETTLFGMKHKPIFDTPLPKIIKRGFPAPLEAIIRIGLGVGAPLITQLLHLKLFAKVEEFMLNYVHTVCKNTTQDHRCGQHFAELCYKNQRNRILKDDTEYELELTDKIIAANLFFAIAGSVETGTSVLFSVLLLLAQNPHVQDKLYKEINDTYRTCAGELTYDVINAMIYLDKVVKEAIRMFPSVPFSFRKCTQDTVLPVGDIKVDKGTIIIIPTYSHHHDPNYFTNPEVFDPERFADTTLASASIYKPFGRGPRMCIAVRYSRLQLMVVLLHIVRNFKLEMIPGNEKVTFARNIFIIDFNDMSLELISR